MIKSRHVILPLIIGILHTSCVDPLIHENDLYNNYLDSMKVIEFMSITPDNIPADSISSSLIQIRISRDADSAFRDVLISTDRGRFSNGNDSIIERVNSHGTVNVELISSSLAGRANLKATVKDISIDTSLYFVTSYPEDFLLSASSYELDSGETSYLKITPYREMGIVSSNIKVGFEVQKADSITVYPIIPHFGVISSGVCSVRVENPYHAKGQYTFIAIVPESEDDSLEQSILLTFN